MTWTFAYLCVFLLGFTLAMVTGLARRVIHPSILCDGVTAPSPEHWTTLQMPKTDLVISFITVFGLATFFLHGFGTFGPHREIALGLLAGLLGCFFVRVWLCRAADPTAVVSCEGSTATVVRDIPAHGYGQVEVSVGSCRVKLAARSNDDAAIPNGTPVTVLDRQESVVVVSVAG